MAMDKWLLRSNATHSSLSYPPFSQLPTLSLVDHKSLQLLNHCSANHNCPSNPPFSQVPILLSATHSFLSYPQFPQLPTLPSTTRQSINYPSSPPFRQLPIFPPLRKAIKFPDMSSGDDLAII